MTDKRQRKRKKVTIIKKKIKNKEKGDNRKNIDKKTQGKKKNEIIRK